MIYIVITILFSTAFFRTEFIVLMSTPLMKLYFLKKAKRDINKSKTNIDLFSIPDNLQINKFKAALTGFSRYYIWLVSRIHSHHIRDFIYKDIMGVKMAKTVTIYSCVEFRDPFKITIGEGSSIGDNVILDGRNEINIGKSVNFSSNVSIWTEQHDHRDPYFRCETQSKSPVIIGDRCWLGPNSIILHSVKIGEGAVVAAGAVVTKDVPPFCIVGGIPAHVIGTRNKDLRYNFDGSYLPFM
jgi:acetyltransferase-like isoleucine patch superfamily enzyme